MSSILEMRKQLLKQNKKDSPKITNRAKGRQGRSRLQTLTGEAVEVKPSLSLSSINNKEELMNMLKTNNMHAPDGINTGMPAGGPPPPPIQASDGINTGMPAGGPPPPPIQASDGINTGMPAARPMDGPGGTGITKATQDKVRAALMKSTSFRPKAVIVDKDAAEKMVINENDPLISEAVRQFEEANTTENPDGTQKVKKVQLVRVLKQVCLEKNKNPIDFAKQDSQGNFLTEAHKPNVIGAIITFPGTESGGEVTEIIKKNDLYSEVQARGGAGIIGNIDEGLLDKSKFEIPVNFVVTPTKRMSTKTGDYQESEKITVSTSSDRKKQWFPDSRIVSMYNMFDVFPKEDFELNRVIPRRVHSTVRVNDQDLAVIEISEADREKFKKDGKISLARYKVEDNPLTPGVGGAEIAAALGVTASSLSTAFETQRASATLEKNTQADQINAYMKDLNKKSTKEFQYMNFFKSFQSNN